MNEGRKEKEKEKEKERSREGGKRERERKVDKRLPRAEGLGRERKLIAYRFSVSL
jgi:hypothetical protein